MGIILRQSFKSTIITYLGVGIAYLNLILILPYCLEVEQIGVVRLVVEAAVFFALFFQLGAPYILIRYKPLAHKQNNQGILGVSSVFALAGMLLFALFFWVFEEQIAAFYSERSQLFVDFMQYVLPLTLIIIGVNLVERYAHANKRIVVPNVFREVFIRIVLALMVLAFFLNFLSFELMLAGIVLSYVLQFFALLWYGNRLEPIKLRPSKDLLSRKNLLEFGNYAGFITIGAVGGGLVGKLDVMMLGSLAGLTEVGIYSTMFYVTTVIEMPRRALTQISNPIIAEHIANDEMKEVESLYKKTSINQLIVGVLLFFLVWFNLDSLFTLMPKGEVFQQGKWVVFIIGLTKIYDLATGINNQILLNSKFYRFSLVSMFVLSGIAIISNLMLIPIYGINGAAIATFISIFSFNTLLLIFIHRKFKIHPFSFRTFQLLLVGMAVFGLLFMLPELENPLLNICLRSVLLVVLFALPVYFLNISEDLNGLLRNILRRLGIMHQGHP